MRTVTVIIGQNLMDIAMQEYGEADSLSELCDMNGLEIDQDIYPGQILTLRELTDADEVAKYYKSNRIRVSSNNTEVPAGILSTGGDEPITTGDDSLIGT